MRPLAFAVALLATAIVGTSIASEAQSQTPRKGGTIRLTAPYGSSLTSLDVHTTPRAQDGIVSKILHRSLYRWDAANNKPILELATDVKGSGGGTVYTYTLRKDAYFHNGRQMTADDVIWSWTRLMDATKGFPGARYVREIKGAVDVEKGQAKEITGLRKIDDFTVEVTLNQKIDPGFSFFQDTVAIVPREEIEKGTFVTKPIGLGPFKFVEHVPGSRLVAERWEKFYQPGKPHADRIVVMIMGEAAARDVAFRSKEIDASILGPAQYVAYKNDPELSKNILEVAEVFTRHMGLNPNFKPFSDKRVRQAINHAIDAELIVKRLAKEKAFVATSWLPLSSPAYDQSLKPYKLDPDRAKKLLAEAGYPNGFEVEVTVSQNESWGLPILEATMPYLQRVGIKVKAKVVETAVLQEIILKGGADAWIYSNATGPDPLAALKCFHSGTPRTACNYTGFKNAELDELLDDAGAADDPEKRFELLRKANALLFEEAPVWFYNYNKAVMAHQPWLHGLQPNATELAHQYPEDLWVDERSPAK
jgi:peptide/nickel transport system substrate-binding protein